jgi:hypothetical protein
MNSDNITKDYIITNHKAAISERISNASASKEPEVMPFRLSILGAPSLRGQNTTSRYETFLGEQRS